MSSSAEHLTPANVQALPAPVGAESQALSVIPDATAETSSTKAKAEEAQAVIKAMSEGIKAIVETPGLTALLQGYGQAAAMGAERLTARQLQEHERQTLILTQNHERAVQYDRLQHEQQQQRNSQNFRLILAFMGMLVFVGILAIAAIKLGWIDEKVATVGGAFFAVSGTVAMKVWFAKKATPPPAPPAQTP